MRAEALRRVRLVLLLGASIVGGTAGGWIAGSSFNSHGRAANDPNEKLAKGVGLTKAGKQSLTTAFETAWAEIVQGGPSVARHCIDGLLPSGNELSPQRSTSDSQHFFYLGVRAAKTDGSELSNFAQRTSFNEGFRLSAAFLEHLNALGKEIRTADAVSRVVNSLTVDQFTDFAALILCHSSGLEPCPVVWDRCLALRDSDKAALLHRIMSFRELTQAFRNRLSDNSKFFQSLFGMVVSQDVPPATTAESIQSQMSQWTQRPVQKGEFERFHKVLQQLPSHLSTLGSLAGYLDLKGDVRSMALSFWAERMASADPNLAARLLNSAGAPESLIGGWYSLVRNVITADTWTASAMMRDFPRGAARDKLIVALVQTRLTSEETAAWISEISDPVLRAQQAANYNLPQ